MKIVLEPGYDHREELGALFAEYTQMLLEKKPRFGGYLEQQGYDTELDHLRDKYGPPNGCLYLATVDGQAAGCMALRRINDREAELKRLYVRPQFRHLGVAQKLVDQILADARQMGYEAVLLDTFPFLEEAIRLYRRHGFYQVPSYNGSPMEDLIYLRLDLKETP